MMDNLDNIIEVLIKNRYRRGIVLGLDSYETALEIRGSAPMMMVRSLTNSQVKTLDDKSLQFAVVNYFKKDDFSQAVTDSYDKIKNGGVIIGELRGSSREYLGTAEYSYLINESKGIWSIYVNR